MTNPIHDIYQRMWKPEYPALGDPAAGHVLTRDQDSLRYSSRVFVLVETTPFAASTPT